MAHIFISYARKDAEFARRLFTQLQQEGRDVWIDWDDIPLTADWWAEICAGIEAADAFGFIITPASLLSPICTLEVDHARQQHKRLIPIVRARVDDKTVLATLASTEVDANTRTTLGGRELVSVARENWQALSRYNWIFFDDDANFETSYQNLTKAIDTDLTYVQEHTRVLVRAHEWDRNGRSKSFLLRGEDLKAAEKWLSTRGKKEPEPTPLHQQYIVMSRTAERVGRRRLLTSVITALVVTLVLATLALIADRNADVERGRANLQERISLSRQLAERAGDIRNRHLDIALLLGVEGVMRYDEPRTQSAALQVLSTTPQLLTYLRGHSGRITALAVRSDGQVIASGDNNGEVILWDVSTGQRLGLELDVTFAVNALHFGPDKNQIMISTNDGALAVWDVNARETIQQLRKAVPNESLVAGGAENWAEFTTDGRRIVTANVGGKVAVWDVLSGDLIEEITVGTGIFGNQQIDSVAIAPNGALIAIGTFSFDVSESGLTITLWNIGDGTKHTVTGDATVGASLAFSPDSNTLVFAEREQVQHRLVLWDVTTRSVKRAFPVDFYPIQIRFGPDGRHLLGTNEMGDVTVFEVESQQQILPHVHGHNAAVTALATFADGRHFVTGSDDSRIALWNLDGVSQIAQPLAPDAQGSSVVFNGDGTLIALANERMIEIRHVEDGSLLMQPFAAHNDYVEQILFRPLESELVSVSLDQAKLWDISGDEARLLATVEHPDLSSMAFNPDGRSLVTASFDGSIRVWDAENGDLLSEPELVFGNTLLENIGIPNVIQSAAFSPDGQILATNHLQVIYLWNTNESGIASEEPRMVLESPSDDSALFWVIQFSPDGRLLAASADNGAIMVWDTTTGQLTLPPLLGHESGVWSLSFDPTSRILASGNYRDGLRLWDVASGDSLGDPLQSGTIAGITFSPVLVQNGPLLASVGERGPRLWYLNVEAWRTLACSRSKLVMNGAEWQTYLGAAPYRVTCPEVALSEADYLSLQGEQQAAADLMIQAVASAVQYENAALNDALCRYGALDLLHEIVLSACNQAIVLEPENGYFYDSRGLAHALQGETQEAIEDFTAFVTWSHENDLYDTAGTQREVWIEALRRGEQPFDPETRSTLRAEFAARSSYKVTTAYNIPLLSSEQPPPPQAMTHERLAEKIAEAALPFDPIIPSNIVNGFPGWFLDGADRIDRSGMDDDNIKLLAPGPDAFGLRLIPTDAEEGLIAIFQSNGPYANLEEWSNDAPVIFAGLRLDAEEYQTLLIEGIEVRKFVTSDTANYLFVLHDLQFVVYATMPQVDTDLLEKIVTSIIND